MAQYRTGGGGSGESNIGFIDLTNKFFDVTYRSRFGENYVFPYNNFLLKNTIFNCNIVLGRSKTGDNIPLKINSYNSQINSIQFNSRYTNITLKNSNIFINESQINNQYFYTPKITDTNIFINNLQQQLNNTIGRKYLMFGSQSDSVNYYADPNSKIENLNVTISNFNLMAEGINQYLVPFLPLNFLFREINNCNFQFLDFNLNYANCNFIKMNNINSREGLFQGAENIYNTNLTIKNQYSSYNGNTTSYNSIRFNLFFLQGQNSIDTYSFNTILFEDHVLSYGFISAGYSYYNRRVSYINNFFIDNLILNNVQTDSNITQPLNGSLLTMTGGTMYNYGINNLFKINNIIFQNDSVLCMLNGYMRANDLSSTDTNITFQSYIDETKASQIYSFNFPRYINYLTIKDYRTNTNAYSGALYAINVNHLIIDNVPFINNIIPKNNAYCYIKNVYLRNIYNCQSLLGAGNNRITIGTTVSNLNIYIYDTDKHEINISNLFVGLQNNKYEYSIHIYCNNYNNLNNSYTNFFNSFYAIGRNLVFEQLNENCIYNIYYNLYIHNNYSI